MPSCWEQLIVVTSSVMPSDLVKALLDGGAKAVVCQRADCPPSCTPQAVADFMIAFYQQLLSGRPIITSLARAGGSLSFHKA